MKENKILDERQENIIKEIQKHTHKRRATEVISKCWVC